MGRNQQTNQPIENQRRLLTPRPAKDHVKAQAATTILCTFAPCAPLPNPPSGVSCQHDGNIVY